MAMNFVIEFHWFDELASSDWLFEWLGEFIINELGSLSFIQMFQKFSLIDWLIDWLIKWLIYFITSYDLLATSQGFVLSKCFWHGFPIILNRCCFEG